MDTCRICGGSGRHAPGCPADPDTEKKSEGKPQTREEHSSEDLERGAEEVELFFNESLNDILEEQAEKFNEGNNGIVMRINLDKVSDLMREEFRKRGVEIGGESVVKVLKIYSKGTGRKEFEMQRRAHEIAEMKKDDPSYAKVPQAYMFRDMEISEDLQSKLKMTSTGFFAGKRIEMFMMDYVDGEDIATQLYKEVVRTHPRTSHLADSVDEMGFDDLMKEAASALGYTAPGGKARNEGERQFEEHKNMQQNAKLLFGYLEKRDYQVHPAVVEQIKNTVGLFHENGLAFRDGHHRNFIVAGDMAVRGDQKDASPPQVFIIDYGSATEFEGKFSTDLFQEEVGGMIRQYPVDDAVARDLTPFTVPPEERATAEERAYADSLEKLAARIGKRNDPKWETFKGSLNEEFEKGGENPDAAYAVFLMSPARSNMDAFLAVLHQEAANTDTDRAKKFLLNLMKKISIPDRNKIAKFLKTM